MPLVLLRERESLLRVNIRKVTIEVEDLHLLMDLLKSHMVLVDLHLLILSLLRILKGGASTKRGSTRKAVGGAVRSVGRLLKKGLKKAIGGTARAVSRGADKVAKRMGEEIEMIELEVADDMSDMREVLEASGKFSETEIENILKVSED